MRCLYFALHPTLLRFVARRVASSMDAEDVCQEVWQIYFLKYRYGTLTEADSSKVLYPIARYRIAEYWRRRGRSREDPHDGESLTLLAESLRADPATCLSSDRKVDLEKALALLPHRQCEALHFHYVDGLTAAETSTLMGVSVNTVKKFLARGLKALRTTTLLDTYRPEGGRE
ncbi:RNA polymerase sigma factor [Kibdelosporangium aridum]|uniref:RNA polymerase sigma factor n=1 Tax=Kibdelosporangium aridum TaxID=2030 RepID=UPI0035EA5EB5